MKIRTCAVCGKLLFTKNERGINLKLLGKDPKNMHCYKHLAKYLSTSEDALKASIEAYKYQGCPLFE